MYAHKEQAAALVDAGTRDALAKLHGIVIPANLEKLRALNSYAVQFRYEGAAVQLVASTECEAIAESLGNWAKNALEKP